MSRLRDSLGIRQLLLKLPSERLAYGSWALSHLTCEHAPALAVLAQDDPPCPLKAHTPPHDLEGVQRFITYHQKHSALFALLREGQLVGYTGAYKFDDAVGVVTLGPTWLHPPVRGTAAYAAGKLLLLRAVFDHIGCLRAQFLVRASNTRSAQAMFGMGARYEGTLRCSGVDDKGPYDEMVFGVVAPEWPHIRDGLEGRLDVA